MKERMIIKKNEQKFNSNILADDIYYEGTIEDWCNITFSIFCLNPMKYAKHFYMKDNNNEYKEVKTIIIPNTVTEIGDYQFHGFNNITSITIPNSITSIGRLAFAECRSLDKVYYEGTLVDWCSITFNDSHSNPMFYGKHFYMRDSNNEYQEVKEIIIPNTITKLGDYQFSGFNNAISITIPNSVTNIGFETFGNCKSLDKVYYEGTIVDWCNISFHYLLNSYYSAMWHYTAFDPSYSNPMFYAKHFYMKDSNNEYQEVKEIIIPDTIKKIGNYQFCGFNNVTSIVIPNSVESIDDSAFLFCPSLTINCEAASKPSGWHSNWNAADCKVVWRYNK